MALDDTLVMKYGKYIHGWLYISKIPYLCSKKEIK